MFRVKDIRDLFVKEYKSQNFITDKTGCKVIELIGHSFIADDNTIFGIPNEDYLKRELDWYLTQSLNVNDMQGEVPKIWKSVASPEGKINSNYGWCVFSEENHDQYYNCLKELIVHPDSRRAVMIYNRPSMWEDYKKDGMNEFMCTFSTQFFIRNNKLICYVLMRSNDSVFGYKNDYAWHKYVTERMYNDLKAYQIKLDSFEIIWTSGSLHIYEPHFYLLDYYIQTGKVHITKKEWDDINLL